MELIEKAYRLFENYKISEIKNACTVCCLSEAEVNNLLNLSKSEIPLELLATYNDSAQAHEPEVEEFKYFLPRYFELIDKFEFPSHSLELSIRNLSCYDVNLWPIEEKKFLHEFLLQFFEKCINTYPIPNNGSGLTPILIMLEKGGYGISQFLDLWEKNNSISGCLHYKVLMADDFNWLRKSKISNPFGSQNISNLLYEWSRKTKIIEKYIIKIEEIILEEIEIEEDELNQLNWLYDNLKLT